MKTIPFNVNHNVRVRLTDEGRRLMRERHDQLVKPYIDRGLKEPHAFREAPEDADGWSTWQLWVLMETFGQSIYNGCRVPFETGIQIEIET